MRIVFTALLCAVLAIPALAQNATADVTALLRDFLAHVDKIETHDRFWADDVVYTSGKGVVRHKADILNGMKSAPAPKPGEPKITYDAQEITVTEHGDFAVLNFKLVQMTDGKVSGEFRNTGTLRKRKGKWQVIAWQATPIDSQWYEKPSR